jgi:hypothetical protein
MELPAIVNRIAPGLLRSLGLQNTGRNPSALSDTIVPMMDLRDWIWTQSELVLQANGVAVAGNGNFLTVGTTCIVPDGEWWYVKNSAAVVAPAAASSVTASVGWRVRDQAGANTTVYPSPSYAIIASQSWYMSTPGGFFIPPGSQPVLSTSLNVGTTGWGFSLVAIRLPI